MTGTTIAGTYMTGITLSNPATQKPLTISGTGLIDVTAAGGNGIYGTNAAAWSIYNYGTVMAPTRGVLLAAGGSVDNMAAALIAGGYRGVEIKAAAGTVTNAGTISGTKQEGVRLNADGSVTNLAGGSISGNATYGAVYINQGGIISNAAGAMIAAGVTVHGAAGTVINAGSINTGSVSTDGVALLAGGSVSNSASAAIAGVGIGVYLTGGTLTNAGTITGATYAVRSVGIAVITNLANGLLRNTANGDAVNLLNGGIVVNATGGQIIGNSGGNGINTNGGSVSNAGTIFGYSNAVKGAVNVSNLAGGVLTAMGNGAIVTGYLYNAGSIFGSGNAGVDVFGTIFNQAGGLIYGPKSVLGNGSATLINAGSLFSVAEQLAVVTNMAGGLIGGITGVGTVTNAGTIRNGGIAIYSSGGGPITNAASGLIVGAVGVQGSQLTVFNSGTIEAAGTLGVRLGINDRFGGTISNASGATITGVTGGVYAGSGPTTLPPDIVINDGVISGGYGVKVGSNASPSGTVVNAGTIIGTDGYAAEWFGRNPLLAVDPGAVFDGTVKPVNYSGTLELEAGVGGSGTLPGFGTSILNFGSITFDPGAAWTIAGNTSGLSGTISGFAQSDTVDLVGLNETVHDYTNGTLTLVGDQTVKLHLTGSFTTASFLTAPDAGTGTDIFLACFVRGTRIATPHGNAPVERLRVDDHVLSLTDGGELMPRSVRWIGRRRIDLARHPRPHLARPIRIRRGAFGDDLPCRDLLLSPDHAVFAEGVLIPVRYLQNGHSVAATSPRQVEYFHVELDQHAVILAEGLAVESYLDIGDRSPFENSGAATQLFPDLASRTWEAGGCARLVVTGPEVASVQHQLVRTAASCETFLARIAGPQRLP